MDSAQQGYITYLYVSPQLQSLQIYNYISFGQGTFQVVHTQYTDGVPCQFVKRFDILKCVWNQIGDFYRNMLYGILIKDIFIDFCYFVDGIYFYKFLTVL